MASIPLRLTQRNLSRSYIVLRLRIDQRAQTILPLGNSAPFDGAFHLLSGNSTRYRASAVPDLAEGAIGSPHRIPALVQRNPFHFRRNSHRS